jgi:hypothetical protein
MISDWFGFGKKKLRNELASAQKALKEALGSQVVLGQVELEEIADTLFPPLQIHKKEDKEFYVDYAVDMNLAVVLKDIQTSQIDQVTVASLKEAMGRVDKVRNIFSIQKNFKRDIKYYVVGNNFNPEYLEDIEVKADPL